MKYQKLATNTRNNPIENCARAGGKYRVPGLNKSKVDSFLRAVFNLLLNLSRAVLFFLVFAEPFCILSAPFFHLEFDRLSALSTVSLLFRFLPFVAVSMTMLHEHVPSIP